jgi:hypothetical protein
MRLVGPVVAVAVMTCVDVAARDKWETTAFSNDGNVYMPNRLIHGDLQTHDIHAKCATSATSLARKRGLPHRSVLTIREIEPVVGELDGLIARDLAAEVAAQDPRAPELAQTGFEGQRGDICVSHLHLSRRSVEDLGRLSHDDNAELDKRATPEHPSRGRFFAGSINYHRDGSAPTTIWSGIGERL